MANHLIIGLGDITVPSEERKIKMYPIDFEEFAVALGKEVLLDYIKECFLKNIPLEQEKTDN